MNRPVKIVVAGGVAAGPSAAAKAKRTNPLAEISLYEAGPDVSYGVCEMPYLISGELSSPDDLTLFTPESLAAEKGIQVYTGHVVQQIRPTRKLLQIKNLKTGGISDVHYDKLILATGSTPKRLPEIPHDAENCFNLATLTDARGILSFIERNKPASVCIIGAGFTGIETAESFLQRRMTVTILDNTALPLTYMDKESRSLIAEILSSSGISLNMNAAISSAETGKKRISRLATSAGPIAADMYLVAAGIEPNVQIAKEAGIKLGTHGGIVADQRQMTSIDGIYAAGDCAEVLNLTTRRSQLMPFATIASKTGRVAGENAAGGHAAFKGAVPVSAIQAFGYEFAQAGSAEDALIAAGFDTVHTHILAKTRVGFMPGAQSILVSMTADRRTRRLLNANIIAKEHAAQRVNTVAMAIRHTMTIDDYVESDFVYTPRLAPLWDPLLLCAQQLQKKLK